MKIFELLSGTTQPTDPASSGATAPMANPAMGAMPNPSMGAGAPAAGTNPAAPMQTAGLASQVGNFFSTPQPIGGAKPPAAAPTPVAPNGQPAQNSGSVFGNRMFGNSAVGQTLDKVNGGLTGTLPKPAQPPQQ